MALIGHPLAQFDVDRLHEIVRGQVRVILANENCHPRPSVVVSQPRGAYWPPDNPTLGALKVSPHDAHRQAVSFVICFASVPTFVEPHAGQVGRVGSSVDMQPSSLWNDFREATVHRGRNAKKAVTTVADRICKCILKRSVSAMRVHQHGDDHAHCDPLHCDPSFPAFLTGDHVRFLRLWSIDENAMRGCPKKNS
jgi:hypothetical protein